MQNGTIVKRSGRWYVRYWERRNINGTVQQKRVSQCLGSVITRGKLPPADIKAAAAEHLTAVTHSKVKPKHVTTIGDFVESKYLEWVKTKKRPSTARSYSDIWKIHLKPICADAWLKNTRTYDVQGWLDSIDSSLSRSTHKHVKNLLSSIFKVAKQKGFFDGVNPVTDSAINSDAIAPEETYAYSLEEINGILVHLSEPAATAFAIAAFSGLRVGEIEGLNWSDYRDGEIHVSRSIWNGLSSDPKTRKSAASVPVIKPLMERLEIHRLRYGNPVGSVPMFTTGKGTRLSMHNVRERAILPALQKAGIQWHGWHACRRGLGSNLYHLGVPDMVIQRILRHANVSTTTGYYIKTVANDVREAMAKLENSLPKSDLDTNWTPTGEAVRLN
jgi:integrase